MVPVFKDRWGQPCINNLTVCTTETHVCLRDYFGLKRNAQLHFSPIQFPSPVKLDDGDNCESFTRLKQYIIEQSKKEGEVACSGGGKKGKSRRFTCKTKLCKFYFVLKWDKYGYYIHYYIILKGTALLDVSLITINESQLFLTSAVIHCSVLGMR